MPLGGMYTPFSLGNVKALSQGDSASVLEYVADLIQNLSSFISAGLLNGQIPTPPVGSAISTSIVLSALTKGDSSSITNTVKALSDSISAIAPNVPSVGLGILLTSLQSALNRGDSADILKVANEISMSANSYFVSGGVV